MKLDLPERIALLGILPHEGTLVTLRIIMELQAKVGFTEEEIKKFGLKDVIKDNVVTISWNPALATETKDIEIGDVAKALIATRLKQLDSQGKLHLGMLPLYEKFVEGKE